jgi:hypothetical protein
MRASAANLGRNSWRQWNLRLMLTAGSNDDSDQRHGSERRAEKGCLFVDWMAELGSVSIPGNEP